MQVKTNTKKSSTTHDDCRIVCFTRIVTYFNYFIINAI